MPLSLHPNRAEWCQEPGVRSQEPVSQEPVVSGCSVRNLIGDRKHMRRITQRPLIFDPDHRSLTTHSWLLAPGSWLLLHHRHQVERVRYWQSRSDAEQLDGLQFPAGEVMSRYFEGVPIGIQVDLAD